MRVSISSISHWLRYRRGPNPAGLRGPGRVGSDRQPPGRGPCGRPGAGPAAATRPVPGEAVLSNAHGRSSSRDCSAPRRSPAGPVPLRSVSVPAAGRTVGSAPVGPMALAAARLASRWAVRCSGAFLWPRAMLGSWATATRDTAANGTVHRMAREMAHG